MDDSDVYETCLSEIIQDFPTKMIEGKASLGPVRIEMVFGLLVVFDRSIGPHFSSNQVLAETQICGHGEYQRAAGTEDASDFANSSSVVRNVFKDVETHNGIEGLGPETQPSDILVPDSSLILTPAKMIISEEFTPGDLHDILDEPLVNRRPLLRQIHFRS